MIRFHDSFNHYATADLLVKYDRVSGNAPAITSSVGRWGGKALTCGSLGDGNLRNVGLTIDSQATWIVSFSRWVDATTTAEVLWRWLDSTTEQVDLRLTTGGALQVTRNGTVLGTTAAGLILASAFYNIVFKVLIHASAGTVDLWISGVSVLSLTGQNTKNSSNATADNFYVQGAANGPRYSDLVVMDGTGSVNNNYTGGSEMRVDAYFPTTDASPNAFTTSTGTDHAALVKETSPDGDTSYVLSATSGDEELWNYADSALTGVVLGVGVCTDARKDDAGTISIKATVKSGSAAEVPGAAKALTSSYHVYREVYETDPNTSAAWTFAGVNAAKFGVKVA